MTTTAQVPPSNHRHDSCSVFDQDHDEDDDHSSILTTSSRSTSSHHHPVRREEMAPPAVKGRRSQDKRPLLCRIFKSCRVPDEEDIQPYVPSSEPNEEASLVPPSEVVVPVKNKKPTPKALSATEQLAARRKSTQEWLQSLEAPNTPKEVATATEDRTLSTRTASTFVMDTTKESSKVNHHRRSSNRFYHSSDEDDSNDEDDQDQHVPTSVQHLEAVFGNLLLNNTTSSNNTPVQVQFERQPQQCQSEYDYILKHMQLTRTPCPEVMVPLRHNNNSHETAKDMPSLTQQESATHDHDPTDQRFQDW